MITELLARTQEDRYEILRATVELLDLNRATVLYPGTD